MYGRGSKTAVLSRSGSAFREVSSAITEIRSPFSFDLGVDPNQPDTVSEMPPNVSQPERATRQARQTILRKLWGFIEPVRLQGDWRMSKSLQGPSRERSRNLHRRRLPETAPLRAPVISGLWACRDPRRCLDTRALRRTCSRCANLHRR